MRSLSEITYRLPQEIRLTGEFPGPKSRELTERRARVVPAGVASSTPVYAADADGGVVVDVDGNSLVDLGSGIAVTSVGASAPAVVDGVREAARERVYHELDRAFRAWLAALEPTSRPDEPRRAWQRTVRSTCIEIADELIRSAGVPALSGRVVPMRTGERLLNAPLAEVYFRNDLRRALTLTTADTSTKEAS